MNIVVCVKQTPDTAATVTVEGGQVSWGDSPLVLNPWDEYAVEEALRTKEAHGGKVTAVSMGPESAKDALKQALAMGCDEAILISDEALKAADSLATSHVLAAAIGKLDSPELVFFGKASVDSASGVTFAQTARLLGKPLLSQVAGVTSIDPDSATITVERLLPEGPRSGRIEYAGRGQRDQGDQRAPLPLFHGDPQSFQGRDPDMGRRRPGHGLGPQSQGRLAGNLRHSASGDEL